MRIWAVLASVGIVAASVGVSTPPRVDALQERRLSVPDRPIRWLAAGDSYSSGEGLADASDWDCQRADRSGVHTSAAWAEVAHEALSPRELPLEPGVGPDGGFDFVACTGAVTEDLFNDSSGNNKKEWDAANGRFDLVTFSFSGNNIGFDNILKQCIGWSLSGLGAAVAGGVTGGVVGGVRSWLNLVGCPAEQDIRRAIADLASGGNDYNGRHLPELPDFYERVAANVVTPGGNVVVVGYPAFVEDPQFWPLANRVMGHCQGIRKGDALMLRRVAGYLNQTIGQAVKEANDNPQGVHFTFLDVNTGKPDAGIANSDHRLFEPSVGVRHNLCATDAWLNGAATGFTTGTVRKERSFHPTQEGHGNEGALVADVIRGLKWADLKAPAAVEESGDPLPIEAWTVVGGTTLTPTTNGRFVLQASALYWSGARAAAPGCDYRFSGEGRAIAGHGYGFVARAEFDEGGTALNGHGVQYDPEAGGYRDVEFPEVESAPITSAPTDDGWHRIAIEVTGDDYRSFVDGLLVYAGTTDALCGELYLRVWRGTSELRNLRVQALS